MFYAGGIRSSSARPRSSPRSPRPKQQRLNTSGIRSYFQEVDTNRSGTISSQELKNALNKGFWQSFAFSLETCKLMIAMFDRNGNGLIDFNEFEALWQYICDWTDVFQSIDRNNSGFVDKNELVRALTDFGYRLSDDFYNLLIYKFSRHKDGRVYSDSFIQCCIMLQTVTAAFAEKDTDRDGVITIQYEEFLRMIFFFKMALMGQAHDPRKQSQPNIPSSSVPPPPSYCNTHPF